MSKNIIIGILLLLSGCTSYPVTYTATPPLKPIVHNSYTLNKITHARVGDALISQVTIANTNLKVDLVLAKTYVPVDDFSLYFNNGEINFIASKQYYSTYSENGLDLINTKTIPPNGVKSFSVYLPIDTGGNLVGEYLLYSKSLPYTSSFSDNISTVYEHRNFNFSVSGDAPKFNYIGKKLKPRTDKPVEYFRQELIYSGKFNNMIKILYREYNSLMIKGSFTQEITYDVGVSNMIRYKQFKIKVLSSDNEGINYIVIDD